MIPKAGWSPKLVPYGADQIVYLVVDSFSAIGTVYRETEVERTDFETIIADSWLANLMTQSALSPSTHLSIGRSTFRKRLPPKSKPDAISTVFPCPSMSATSWTATGAR